MKMKFSIAIALFCFFSFIYGQQTIVSNSILNVCKPEFPLKDGWLGGDGDVSVPLDSNTTLFIFSDSYVARKKQNSRKDRGLRMVSNSVAVQKCLPNGKNEVTYYWNKMYSKRPKPIFKSPSKKYLYWVNDGYFADNALFVILEKIGQKENASPDDIFKFSLLGFVLAKIYNPYDDPNEWNIEYTALPNLGNPFLGLRCHVLLENYVYFFVSRHDTAQVLVRKPISSIDRPEEEFEYYALDETWKSGLDTFDMKTIKGFRSNTVKYHPDRKEWIMILDIKFLDNKIKMRTAPNLTGPWSDEIAVYEIPEITPGNEAFHKNNFCYLSRECIQNYDPIKQEILVTYDINNSIFSEILANSKIYTPKVISIPLNKF